MSTPPPLRRKRPRPAATKRTHRPASTAAPRTVQSYTLYYSGYWITWDGTTFTFNFDSVVWSIAASDYAAATVGAPDPSLVVTITDQRNENPSFFEVKAVLTGARFPGTAIMGDCTFDCQWSFNEDTQQSSNSLTLSWPAMGLSYNGSIYNYPADGFARGTLTLPALTFTALGSAGAVTTVAGASSSAAFKPGVLQLSGTGGLEVTGLGADLLADTLQLSILQEGDSDAYFNDPPSLASLINLSSAESWTVPAPPAETPLGALTVTADLFNTMAIGTGEDDPSATVQGLQLTTTSADPQFSFALGPGIAAPVGPAPILVLSSAMMVYDFTAATPLDGLYAHAVPADSFWAVRDGVAFHFPVVGQPDSTFLNISFVPDQASAGYGWLVSDRFSLSLDLCWLQPAANAVYFALTTDIDDSAIVIGASVTGSTVKILNPTINLVRPADLMVAQLVYDNVALQGSTGAEPQLVVANSLEPSLLIVTLPPQHIAEFVGTASAPVPARMAGPTRLAFSLPPSLSVSVDPVSLLDWTSFDALVVGNDPFPNANTPVAPTPNQTSIELPYRLLLSPGVDAGWSHTPPPTSDSGTVGLWFTRVAARWGSPPYLDERDTPLNRIRRSLAVLWSPDYGNSFTDPVGSSLSAADRSTFVDNFAFENKTGTVPALDVNHCMLSALGAWADMNVSWDSPAFANSPISAWHHVTAQGRDQYVRVVFKGHLFPWGHRANWITVVERTFSGDGENTAVLTETDYVVITERLHDYSSLAAAPYAGRDLPFTAIEVLTTTTPDIDSQAASAISSDGELTGAFWIQSGGDKVNLQMRGYDRETSSDPRGRAIHFAAPAVFVGIGGSAPAAAKRHGEERYDVVTGSITKPADVLDPYVSAAQSAYDSVANTSPVQLAGQTMAYADTVVAGATSHATQALTLLTGDARNGATSWIDSATGAAAFYPTMTQAMVSLPAIQQLAGTDASSVAIGLAAPYLQGGFDNNAGEVYAALQNPLDLAFAGANSNGMILPNMSVSAISRAFGTLPGIAGNIEDLAAGKLNPLDFLDPTATLLGIVPLKTLITEVIDMAQSAANQVPVPGFVSTITETEIILTFDWTSSNLPSIGPLTFAGAGNLGTLDLHINAVAPIVPPGQTPIAPTATTTADISAFDLSLASLIDLTFSALSFVSVTGQKPQVDISLTGVALGGQIDFLEPLMEAAQTLFGDAPSLDMLPDSINIGYSATLPSVDLGVLSLENIRLNSSTTLSLGSDPVILSFGFSDRTHPFTLAIELLGGGGWFDISLVGENVTEIDFGLQAGADASLDLGIASGSVSIMFGIAFLFQAGGDNQITGYVRATGQLTVLQLISIHAEFYLGLTYLVDESKIWGEADLSIEISIAFFSKTVTLTFRKEFPVKIPNPLALFARDGVQPLSVPRDDGTPTVPKIIDVMPDASYWTEYAAAFAV